MRRRDFIAGLGGAAAAPALWPLAARAQQQALPVIGFLSGETNNAQTPRDVAAFRRGLGEHGYLEGRNVEILYRWAERRYDRLPALAAEFVGRRVAMIAAMSNLAALAAKAATATIPIVFATGLDPVEAGLVASLNRPGGNVTGVSFLGQELTAKRLELLHEIVPAAASIGFLANPTGPSFAAQIREAEAAAHILGVDLVTLNASTPAEIEAAFVVLLGHRIGALVPAADAFFAGGAQDQLVALAARHSVAVIYQNRDAVIAGGLMNYGPDVADAYRIAGTYAGRILKGAKPADLPVQRSTRIETVLNLKTAKALGIEVPTATLLHADEVIEADR